MVYLNSPKNGDFEGGSTFFYAEDKSTVMHEIVPHAGSAIMFFQYDPSQLLHSGEEITSGKKYILRTDIMYDRIK